jgi:transposase
VGHSILVVAYHILERGIADHDLGEDYFQQRQQQAADRYAKRLVRQLEQLGHKVTLEPADAA